MTDWTKHLETLGNVLVYGFGDEVLEGFIPAYFEKISQDDCLDYIENDKDLLANVPDKYWGKLRRLVRLSDIEITAEEVIRHLRKNRPDVLSIIINHAKGRAWLNKQVDNCRQKLGLK